MHDLLCSKNSKADFTLSEIIQGTLYEIASKSTFGVPSNLDDKIKIVDLE